MTAVRRFLFDTDFSDPAVVADPSRPSMPNVADAPADDPSETEEPAAPTYSEEELEQAREEGRQAGIAETMRQYAESLEHEMLTLVRAITENLTELSAVQERENAERTREAVAVAKAICAKMIPVYLEKNGIDEVERAVRDAVRDLNEASRILLNVPPAMAEPLGERLDGIVAGSGYDGRIEIVADDSLDAGDCIMSWGDGGAERRLADLWAKVSAVVDEGIGDAAKAFEAAQAQAQAQAEAKARAADAAETAGAKKDAAVPVSSETAAPDSPDPTPHPAADPEEPAPSAAPESAASDPEQAPADADAASRPTPPETTEAPAAEPDSDLATHPETLDIAEEMMEAAGLGEPSPPGAGPIVTDAPLHATTVKRAALAEDPMPMADKDGDGGSDDGAGAAIVDGPVPETADSETPMDSAPAPIAPDAAPAAKAPAAPNALGFEIDEDAEEGGEVDDALDRAMGTLSGERKPAPPPVAAAPRKAASAAAPAAKKSGGVTKNALGLEIDEDAEEGGFVDDALDRALGSLANKDKRKGGDHP
jgi:flagellar assembly protein FliH